jgi:hypothetical protein
MDCRIDSPRSTLPPAPPGSSDNHDFGPGSLRERLHGWCSPRSDPPEGAYTPGAFRAPATLAALTRRCPQGHRHIGSGVRTLDSTTRLYLPPALAGCYTTAPCLSLPPYKVQRVRPSPVLHGCTVLRQPSQCSNNRAPRCPSPALAALTRRCPQVPLASPRCTYSPVSPGSIDVPAALSDCASARTPDPPGLQKAGGRGAAPEVGGG